MAYVYELLVDGRRQRGLLERRGEYHSPCYHPTNVTSAEFVAA